MGPLTTPMSVISVEMSEKRSFSSRVAAMIESFRRDAADRRLREQLADMDDAMLRDIGIADDEMHMIRARNRFTPRAWASRPQGSRWEY